MVKQLAGDNNEGKANKAAPKPIWMQDDPPKRDVSPARPVGGGPPPAIDLKKPPVQIKPAPVS